MSFCLYFRFNGLSHIQQNTDVYLHSSNHWPDQKNAKMERTVTLNGGLQKAREMLRHLLEFRFVEIYKKCNRNIKYELYI